MNQPLLTDEYATVVYRTAPENQKLTANLMSVPWCPTQIPQNELIPEQWHTMTIYHNHGMVLYLISLLNKTGNIYIT
jgi:hypothetical protein